MLDDINLAIGYPTGGSASCHSFGYGTDGDCILNDPASVGGIRTSSLLEALNAGVYENNEKNPPVPKWNEWSVLPTLYPPYMDSLGHVGMPERPVGPGPDSDSSYNVRMVSDSGCYISCWRGTYTISNVYGDVTLYIHTQHTSDDGHKATWWPSPHVQRSHLWLQVCSRS